MPTEPAGVPTSTVAAVAAPLAFVEPAPWPRWQRIAFRFAAVYWLLYAFPGPLRQLVGTAGEVTGWFGARPDAAPWSWLMIVLMVPSMLWQLLVDWMDARGLAPYPVIHQPTGSGDTAEAIAQLLAVLVLTVVLTIVWSLLARSSRGYPRLGRWLHLVVRFDLAFALSVTASPSSTAVSSANWRSIGSRRRSATRGRCRWWARSCRRSRRTRRSAA